VLGPPLRSWSFGSWWAVEYDRFLRSEEQSPRP